MSSRGDDAAGWADTAAKIRSVKIVRRFGVARFRPPRRSPDFEPLGMVLSLGRDRALGSVVINDPRQQAILGSNLGKASSARHPQLLPRYKLPFEIQKTRHWSPM